MAYQLIFTSWPTSLSHGRSGFSTVARSRGMSERLASAVERCCVYDSSAPVVWAHSKIEYASGTWHVISRFCDSGTDYTNRNNYLAHHLVISAEEVSALGLNPVDIILGWKGWRTNWNEEPKFLDNVNDLSSVQRSIFLPAKTWEKIFADSSCAALLEPDIAYTISARPEETDVLLRMFGESSALETNPSNMWLATFTTRFAEGDNPSNFTWRGIANDTASINISEKKCPSAPSGRRADYARTGAMNNREKYNLKVGVPKVYKADFKVVESQTKKFPSTALLAGVSAVSTLIVAAIIFILFLSDGEKDFRKNAPSRKLSETESLVKNPPENVSSSDSKNGKSPDLYQVVEKIRMAIGQNKFSDALEISRNSPFADDEKLKASMLSDIGHRIDYLLQYAENISLLDSVALDDLKRAADYLNSAKDGMDIDASLRTAQRLQRWKTLNGKIK